MAEDRPGVQRKHRKQKRLIGRLVLSALAGLFGALFISQLLEERSRLQDIQGQALARLAARAAEELILQANWVALQRELDTWVKQSPAVFIMVQGLDQNPLAQAGETPDAQSLQRTLEFSHPVVLQEAVAAILTLYTPRLPLPWAFWLLLAGVLGYWALWLHRVLRLLRRVVQVRSFQEQSVQVEPLPSAPLVPVATDTSSAVTLPSGALKMVQDLPENLEMPDIPPVVQVVVQVLLQWRQGPRWQKTLSLAWWRQLQDAIHTVADEALAIYGGHWARAAQLTLDQGGLLLSFSAKHPAQALESAAFFAFVVQQVLERYRPAIHLDAVLGLDESMAELPKRPSSRFVLLWPDSAIALPSKLRLSACGEAWFEIEGFDASVQALLHQQVERLTALITPVQPSLEQ